VEGYLDKTFSVLQLCAIQIVGASQAQRYKDQPNIR